MSHRPYPDRDRALHQLERHDDEHRPLAPRPAPFKVPAPFAGLAAYIQRRTPLRNVGISAAEAVVNLRYNTANLADGYGPTERRYLPQGHHVHRASKDGTVCLGGDDQCTTPRAEADPS